MQEISTKPYLLRALYEWCTDNGYTPHIAVRVDQSTRVPRQFVRDGEIVLNISFEATSQLQMGNEWIEFTARFSGKAHKIEIPVANVLAIYARENGQGMAFQVDAVAGEGEDSGVAEDEGMPSDDAASPLTPVAESGANEEPSEGAGEPPNTDGDGSKGGSRPRLKIVK
ncbi:TPA: ClpXP protease specificity-enhancing factor [Burkholderia vietnamiensis]|uniref:ClpXP protease specificity-enhancing factor n=1 Tax=Burkholderia vietnamiensis TaxID=60552 RepID=UPI00158B8EDE|nr:ClpXP protease specificity-enhancing factor [Burkholderia vietnamiensis]MCA8210617.1 ClpXP protease specificity-enhancing factor [Burkholderia vietnamiensis]HDR9099681.1 ClpXP protease specificity-enhancing factor [Burkholderia vietnamiensis]HDR9120045.1 ClpXP protease specificity-enhancing factor [Burkholderia vietnamiensis]HDR9169176.1 ClpXP protease specificity-enhancing factor [Burkholderia vietnamiensis]HDR9282278.1 ClpXP protease specificity-enhancing factor [Burkholderia vietnamiensi